MTARLKKPRDVFNVREFGATGDGSTDDSSVMQAVIDAAAGCGGTVFFPAGVYMAKNLTLLSGVRLVGTGSGSILKAHPSCGLGSNVVTAEDCTGIGLDNLVLDGNKGVVYGDAELGGVSCLTLFRCIDVSVTNCNIQNNEYIGVGLHDLSDRVNFVNNRFLNLDCGIISAARPVSNILIDGNLFDGDVLSEPIVFMNGVNTGFSEYVNIVNNIVKNHTGGHAVEINGVKHLNISNNIINNCSHGIALYNYHEDQGVSDAVISNNLVSDCLFSGGIVVDGASGCLVSGNSVSNQVGSAYVVNDSTSIALTGNLAFNFNCNEDEGGYAAYSIRGASSGIILAGNTGIDTVADRNGGTTHEIWISESATDVAVANHVAKATNRWTQASSDGGEGNTIVNCVVDETTGFVV